MYMYIDEAHTALGIFRFAAFFFYKTPTDKLKFAYWSEVNPLLGSKITIFWQRMMIASPRSN